MSRVVVFGGARDGRFTGGVQIAGPSVRSEAPNAYVYNDGGSRERAEAEAKRERKRPARLNGGHEVQAIVHPKPAGRIRANWTKLA